VQELAARADELRRTSHAQTAAIGIGELVYDAPPIAVDPFSPVADNATVGAKHARQQVEESALPRPVRTYDSHHRAALDLERTIVDRNDAPEALAQPLDGKDGRGRFGRCTLRHLVHDAAGYFFSQA